MQIGDLVTRKSYGNDTVFKIIDIKKDKKNKQIVTLKGIAFRLIADCDFDDLQKVDVNSLKHIIIDNNVRSLLDVRNIKDEDINIYRNDSKIIKKNENMYGMPGKVLQIDGDKEYLKICLDVYSELGIPAVGVAIAESNQHKEIYKLLQKHNPDIVVITGHDSLTSKKGDLSDISNYRNSLNFIKSVKQARKWEPNKDNLVIFAGACQSNYEQLIKAGANYASSPSRIMIHALDPVFVVEKIACSRIDVIVPLDEVLEQTVTGIKGVGGSETKGKFRWAMPKFIY
ncbi:MAG: sporulation peptidase YabG [Peptostreptococcaceae bacterium]